jgi:hypothetical protein
VKEGLKTYPTVEVTHPTPEVTLSFAVFWLDMMYDFFF